METKKKMCWNCEGNVARDATNCIYCGVYLQREQDLVEEMYEPPFPSNGNKESPEETHEPPFLSEGAKEESSNSIFASAPVTSAWKELLIAQISLSLGGALALFALILFFFSKDGVLTLKWDGEFWIYCLSLGVPLLLIGIRTLSYIEKREEEGT